MAEEELEEAAPRVHPLRQASVFFLAPLIIMDTFLLVFTTVLLAKDLGANAFVAGIISTTAPAVNMPMGLFWGWVADKYGRRPPLMIGALFTIPGLLSFTLATQPWHLVVSAAIRGIGGSAGVPLSKALAADLAPRKVLGERMGAWSMAIYAAPLTGFAIAGPLYEIYDRLPFIAAAVFEFACLLLAAFAIPETLVKRKSFGKAKKTERETETSRITRFRQGAKEWGAIFRLRGVAIAAFALLMGFVGSTAASTIAFPLFASGIGVTATQISLVYVSGMIIPIMGLVPGGAFSDRFGRKWPVLFYGFWGAIMWPLYTRVPGFAFPFLGFVLINLATSIGAVVGEPAMIAYMFSWTHKRERARASAITEFCRDFGTVIGLPLVGLIYDKLSAESAFYYAAIVGIITYIIVFFAWKEPPPTEELGK